MPEDGLSEDDLAPGYDPKFDMLVAISGEPPSHLRRQIARILEKPDTGGTAALARRTSVPRLPATLRSRGAGTPP